MTRPYLLDLSKINDEPSLSVSVYETLTLVQIESKQGPAPWKLNQIQESHSWFAHAKIAELIDV